MDKVTEKTSTSLEELTTEQPDSTDPNYLAWVDREIAQAQEEMKDPSNRIPATKVWETFGIDH